MSDLLIAALVSGGFSTVGVLLQRLIKENRDDHTTVANALGRIEQKIDYHIETHQ